MLNVCKNHNSKSNFVKKKNYIFSDSNIISSTRSTDIVSESDSSPSRNILPFVIANVDGTLISMDTQVKLKKEIETGKVD